MRNLKSFIRRFGVITSISLDILRNSAFIKFSTSKDAESASQIEEPIMNCPSIKLFYESFTGNKQGNEKEDPKISELSPILVYLN